MQDEIKVGDYIRTYYGELAIIKEISPRIKARKLNNKNITLLDFNLIKKYSSNIIDLIEKGDYVNGFLIDYIDLDCKVPFLRSERPYREATTWYKDLIEKGKDYNMCLHFKQEDIKSIVTKEQFKSRECLI